MEIASIILLFITLIVVVVSIASTIQRKKETESVNMWKREAVIAHVMATGAVCSPTEELEDYCDICNKGPCHGPIDQFNKLWP